MHKTIYYHTTLQKHDEAQNPLSKTKNYIMRLE